MAMMVIGNYPAITPPLIRPLACYAVFSVVVEKYSSYTAKTTIIGWKFGARSEKSNAVHKTGLTATVSLQQILVLLSNSISKIAGNHSLTAIVPFR